MRVPRWLKALIFTLATFLAFLTLLAAIGITPDILGAAFVLGLLGICVILGIDWSRRRH